MVHERLMKPISLKQASSRSSRRPRLRIWSTVIVLLIILAGCIEDKNDPTDVQKTTDSSQAQNKLFVLEDSDISNLTELEKQSLSVKDSLQSEYQVIAENNLFRPLGWQKEVLKVVAPKTETVIVETPQERPAPTYNLTLTGIAQNGSRWIAIVEDEAKKEGYFLNRGEKLKDSLVSEIFEEQIILVIGEEKVQFPLGASIQYDANEHILFTITNQSTLPFDTLRTQDKPSIPKSEIRIPNSGGDTQSLIERMKARRRKELGLQ